jgi:transcriptional regulator with XRE-family HTH domain
MQPNLGLRLRALRLGHGYTLSQLASYSGLSKSFLSMLENGYTNVSVTRLQRLAAVFGLGVADLVPEEAARAPVEVMRHGDARPLPGFAAGVEARHLAREGARRLEPILLRLEPGAQHTNVTGHAGEEFVHVLAGTVRLTVAEAAPLELSAGDSASYPSALSHRYHNATAEPALLLTVNTPPRWLRERE